MTQIDPRLGLENASLIAMNLLCPLLLPRHTIFKQQANMAANNEGSGYAKSRFGGADIAREARTLETSDCEGC